MTRQFGLDPVIEQMLDIITVMTAHGEKIGVRAKDIARLIIDRHYHS